jgi:hypothetical protein
MKTILHQFLKWLWTIAIAALVCTCLFLLFQSIQVPERPEVSAETMQRQVEHFVGNMPVWRLPSGVPADRYLVSTDLNFTVTCQMTMQQIVEARMSGEYPCLFWKMLPTTK